MAAMAEQEARRRFADAPVAVLSSFGPDGEPHLVPVTFVLDGGLLLSAVDAKPKRSTSLKRHANLAADPRAALLAQHWEDDWSRLWWVRADGRARLLDDVQHVARVARLLQEKYPQYATVAVSGPVIEVSVERWQGWRAR